MRVYETVLFSIVALICISFSAVAQSEGAAEAGPGPTPEEVRLLELTNSARADQGLGPLKWDRALADAAAAHNALMTGQPALSHQYPGEDELVTRAAQAGAHFAAIAENVAMGPGPDAIQQEWLHSAPHRANIFDPRMDSIGIAVTRRGGDYYATEDFSHAVASVAPEDAEGRVARHLSQLGLALNTQPGPIREARQTCEMAQGSAGGLTPRFIVRLETSNVDQLPRPLTDKLATGQYKSGVVGACTSMHPQQGFTTYRFAVLLF